MFRFIKIPYLWDNNQIYIYINIHRNYLRRFIYVYKVFQLIKNAVQVYLSNSLFYISCLGLFPSMRSSIPRQPRTTLFFHPYHVKFVINCTWYQNVHRNSIILLLIFYYIISIYKIICDLKFEIFRYIIIISKIYYRYKIIININIIIKLKYNKNENNNNI